jgi:two-component system, NarL family, sensor histidine kinase DesK
MMVPVNASQDPSPHLGAFRLVIWWTTAGCLVGSAALVTAELIAGPAGVGASTLVLLAGSLATIIGCAAAGVLFSGTIRGRPAWRVAIRRRMVVLAALPAAGVLTLSQVRAEGGYPWPICLAAVLAAAHADGAIPRRTVWFGGLSAALLASLLGSWWGGELAWLAAAQDTAVVQIWMLRVAERLDRDRRLESAEAVTGERLRFAADLHDIQGHSLQVIALKSELAERLAGVDPQRAVAEMREVQELARQALGDTRAVVQGYRRVTLETEMTNAARVLMAAGIDCRIERDPGLPTLSEPVAVLVGLVVREGTTNVIRHSQARCCVIVLAAEAGMLRLVMRNDVPLGDHPGPPGGLAVLADRVALAGGTLTWHATAAEFSVEVILPAAASVPALLGLAPRPATRAASGVSGAGQ